MNFSSLDFDFGIDLDFNISLEPEEMTEKEYIAAAHLPHKPVCYKNAQDMAADIDIRKDYFCMVSGSFIFGDLFEALIDRYKLIVHKMYISTLGMSQDNVDSIVNLVKYLHVEEINLIVSGYFVGVERHGLVPYLIKELAGLPVKVAVVASHAKITLMDFGPIKLVIHGSANLSSSRNLETFYITHDDGVYDFVENIYSNIMERFTIIDGIERKTIFENNTNNTSQKLWKQIVEFTEGDKT